MVAPGREEMKLYIAGPMTGRAYHNVPAFEAAATELRSQGHDCIVPIELDGDEYRDFCLADPTGRAEAPDERTWGDFLARDVKCIADEVEAVVVLPGWRDSKGARLETYVALLTGKPVYSWDSFSLTPLAEAYVADCLTIELHCDIRRRG